MNIISLGIAGKMSPRAPALSSTVGMYHATPLPGSDPLPLADLSISLRVLNHPLCQYLAISSASWVSRPDSGVGAGCRLILVLTQSQGEVDLVRTGPSLGIIRVEVVSSLAYGVARRTGRPGAGVQDICASFVDAHCETFVHERGTARGVDIADIVPSLWRILVRVPGVLQLCQGRIVV